MKTATSRYEFACDVETFWKHFFDDTYQLAFFKEGLGFPEAKILEKTETKRRMRVVPKLTMPAPVAKLVGDSFAYEEEGTFDKGRNEYTWRMIPSTMKDKLFSSGSVRAEAAGEGRMRRINTMQMEAKVFGLGGLIESSTEKDVTAAWEKEAVFFKKWLERAK
ncbi:MAG: DUF2505 family protein [Polyangiaceae bacterium]